MLINIKIGDLMQGKEPRQFTIQDYDRVIKLKESGLSQNKISEEAGVSSTTAWHWINTSRKPRYLYARKQQRSMLEGSKHLSNELAYIYGVLIGDGCLEAGKLSNRIYLGVCDKDFAYEFAKVLKKWSGFNPTINKRKANAQPRQTKYGNWIKARQDQYVVRLGSKQIVEFLLTKVDSKTYTWKVPKDILKSKNEVIIASFLKGIFDSEGSAIYDTKYNKRRVELTMYGKEVKKLQELLDKIKIKSTVIQRKRKNERGIFILRILDKKSLTRFNKIIGFTIRRKDILLKKGLNSYKREPYDGEKTKKDILLSLRNKPKTVKEISLETNKHKNTIHYHLKKFKENKAKIIGRKVENGVISNLWVLK